MIKITRAEADIMRERVPEAHIAIANRSKKYKRYYIEEADEVIAMLVEIRPDYIPPASYIRKQQAMQNQNRRKRW